MCPLLDFSVLEDMPLYDILNEFQKGHSHMAVVIRKNNQSYQPAEQATNDGGTFGELLCNCVTPYYSSLVTHVWYALSSQSILLCLLSFVWVLNKEVSVAIDDKNSEKVVKNLPQPLRRWKSYPNTQNASNRGNRPKKWSKDQSDVLQVHKEPLPTLSEDEEAVGIITMEDVIEELLQVSGLRISKLYLGCRANNAWLPIAHSNQINYYRSCHNKIMAITFFVGNHKDIMKFSKPEMN